MTRLAIFLACVAGSVVHAGPDVTPNAPRLELTRGTAELRGGLYTFQLFHVRAGKDGIVRASFLLTKNDLDHGVLSMVQWVRIGESLGVISRPLPKDLQLPPDKLCDLLAGENPPEFDPQTKIVLMRRYPDWPIRRCHVEEVPGGKACMGFSEWRAKVPVHEVILEERGGKRITLRAPGLREKMPPDSHCSVHGGLIRARLVTEAERRVVDAGYYLSEADENWKSRNPKLRNLAKASYLKLMKDYSTEAVVVRNLERIKARSETDLEIEIDD